MSRNTTRHSHNKATRQAKSIYGGDWFGCGRTITTESWEGFKKAHAEYYRKVDKAIAQGKPNDPLLGHPRL